MQISAWVTIIKQDVLHQREMLPLNWIRTYSRNKVRLSFKVGRYFINRRGDISELQQQGIDQAHNKIKNRIRINEIKNRH